MQTKVTRKCVQLSIVFFLQSHALAPGPFIMKHVHPEIGTYETSPKAIIERVHRSVLGEPVSRKSHHFSSGGFEPYGMLSKSSMSHSLSSVPSNSGTRRWISRNEVGPPEITAYMINDKGNKVWIKFESFEKTIFPVNESRFYKPRLHKIDFLNKKKKSHYDEE
ncbi:unnamed protein product [Lepeophtheirus salmonis]|uniref:(salmon louse) hypothetical protein n=1 Tax=Lepeophtheirus salmonis TaxID=72036 RepID=A0A7R8D332_LEPSM|nr:unnamed protein product [Lepeophtheirus salmonis]CAF3013100.1 unnamed protein product [Lepeophtheirus salmonis]